jgi:hypothetical protein
VRITAPVAKSASTPKTGFFATLRGLLRARGSGTLSGSAALSRTPVLALALLLSIVAGMAFSVASASAREVHALTGSFNGEPGKRLSGPWGISVDGAAGVVLVADNGNDEVAQFGLSGTPKEFLSLLGSNELTSASFPEGFGAISGLADAPSGADIGDFYVVDYQDGVVDRFHADGEYVSRLTGNNTPQALFSTPVAVRVAPSTGDVWVIDSGHDVVDEFSPEGAYITQIEASKASNMGGEPLINLADLAIDSEGNVYLSGVNSSVGHYQIDKFNSAGVFQNVLDPSGGQSVAVDTSTTPNTVYSLDDRGYLISKFESTSTTGILLEQFGPPEGGELQNIGVDSTTHTVYATDYDRSKVDIFAEGDAPEETPLTDAATGIGFAAGVEGAVATLHGELNPGGKSGALEYRFDYNTDGSCTGGQSIPVPDGEVAEAKEALVEAKATDLEPATRYTYCLLAVNPFGATQGNAVTFVTPAIPPTVASESASAVKATEARLEGVVNPNSQVTKCEFQYGTEASLATSTTVPCEPETLEGFGKRNVGLSVSGLTQGTTYYYRVLATNATGTTKGTIEHFTTAVPPEVPEAKPASAVEYTRATLNGVLDPVKAGGAGDKYEFTYNTGGTCMGGSTTSQVEALGSKEEAVSATATGLQPNTQYTFCLLERNAAEETAVGPPVSFTTKAVAVPTVTIAAVSTFTGTTAHFSGTVDPNAPGAAPGQDPAFDASWHFECTPECPGLQGGEVEADDSAHEVTADATGLQPHTVYAVTLVASNLGGAATAGPIAFTTLAVGPRVEEEAISDVSSSSATLNAQVYPGGAPTTYTFEYAPAGGTFTPIPGPEGTGSVGEGDVNVPVSVNMQQGLLPDTSYEFRLIASNSLETVTGEPVSFTTQRTGSGLTLPDGREWEMVSSPNKHGASIEPIWTELNLQIRASSSGSAMTYETAAPTEAQPGGNTDFSQVLSVRTPAGWVSKDIAVPAIQPTGAGLYDHQEYGAFSTDLSLGLAQPFGLFNPALSAEASEETPYLHSDFAAGGPGDFCTSDCYRPLVTGAPGFANVPEGTKFGESGGNCPQICGPEFITATPDLGHIVLNVASLGSVEWSAGKLTSIPFDPGPRGGISNDGMRISNGGEMFDVATGQTLHFDAAEPQCLNEGKCESGGGEFQIATSDGSKVFFTDGHHLTKDSGSGNLYECEISEAQGKLECNLTDLTPESSVGESVVGISEDGSYVYLVAGGSELEVSHDGAIKLIDAAGGGSPTRVSPDGRWLAFMSEGELTGYDNHDAVSGRPDEEVYLYHAAAGGGENGTLVCASCNPTGARPHGIEAHSVQQGLAGLDQVWGYGQWIAANIPAWSVGSGSREDSPYQSRYLSDGGRLFFNSSDALVPQDTNGTEDVYEYEPPGGPEAPVGDTCTAGSPTYGPRFGGCVGLISSGTSPEESAFLDASENGADVFFLTSSELTPQDHDSALDVYDAHVCSAESPCSPPLPPPPVECQGDACQSPVQAPNDPTPGSLTFQGPGNPTPLASALPAKKKTTKKIVKCKKGSTKNKKGKCVKKSKKKAKAKKSTHRKGSN